MEVIGTNRISNLLRPLLRVLTLRGGRVPGAAASDALIATCAAVALAVWIIADRLQYGPEVEFDGYGIALLALVALLLLALAYLMARLSRPPLPLRATLLLALAPLPLLVVLAALVDRYASGRWHAGALLLLGVGLLLYVGRALRALTGRRQLAALLAAAVLLAGYLALIQAMDLRPTLWAAPDEADEPEAAMAPQVAEELMFDQRERLDAALENVAAGDDARPYSVFFVGFAGVGSQRVFAEEIQLAARVVGRRFDSGSRQLLLVNDHRDLDSYPLASVSGLRYALAGIAGKMDPRRDILFLSLSSHGSDEPLLAVSNGNLPLGQLSGEQLAAALRDAGIRWRIIVISACHAGAFIEPLKDADTIVLTAAAADRTSFGCSDDRDLTYFGEAFYRDALPRASSLEQAFALTRTAIAAREQAEQVTPSDPQAWFGSRIAQRLARQPMQPPVP
jgi:hypothetical protein